MTISELTLKPSDGEPVRRFEVFTGSGRRRAWSVDYKARIVAESYEGGETVSGIARRYALSPQQLFGWRRALRRSNAVPSAAAPLFVPAEMAPAPEPAAKSSTRRRRHRGGRRDGIVEVEIGGIAMRVGRGADEKTVAAVIRALKATS